MKEATVRAAHAVIFDLDGVVLDTQSLAHQALRAAARTLKFDLSAELCLQLIGLNEQDSIARIEEALQISIDGVELLTRYHRRYEELLSKDIPAKAGLFELLDFLEERRVPKAVATSSSRALTEKKLLHFGLAERFAAIITAEQAANGKPAPDIFLMAAAALKVTPKNVFVLEDSDAGIVAAARAQMIPIMIPDLKPPGTEALRLASRVCVSLCDVTSFLQSCLEQAG